MLLQGLFVPLTCPFYRDGASYLRKLEHNVSRYSLSPAAGLVALPPASEASGLTDAEAADSLRSVADTAARSKVLIAGVERASVHAALLLATVAERAGFDAILLAPPPDWARLVRGEDARELLLFYTAVADRSPLPVVLWSSAQPPSVPLPAEAIVRLAEHPNVLGLVDADLTPERVADLLASTQQVRRDVVVTPVFEAVTRRMSRAAEAPPTDGSIISVASLTSGQATASPLVGEPRLTSTLKARVKQVGFQVLSGGSASALVPLLEMGLSAAVPELAACAPQACFEAYAAWKDGDLALAQERAKRLEEVEAVLHRYGPAAVKVGCDFNGYYGGQPRLPRLPLAAAERSAVESALASVRN